MDEQWYTYHARKTLARIFPRLEQCFQKQEELIAFRERLETHFPAIFQLLHRLYGTHYDFFFHVEKIISTAAIAYQKRSPALKALDVQREAQTDWFLNEKMIGAVCYVDRFAGTLEGIAQHLEYLEELGVTYLHLMPLYESPAERNDGGYAVSSFRRVNPSLGTMAQLSELSALLRSRGISLVLDFVFNHTSDEHEWALRALKGDAEFQAYYRMFDTRELPDAYEANLREIFPEQAPGNFLWKPEIQKWVWTTFFQFQWDLNYENPDVFCAMLDEMLFLANQGVEILRLDAVPFIWKQLGTNCENLPEAHILIRAFNALVRACAPALLFKSEAIVHPRDVQSYIDAAECQLSYNPILMVSLWEAMATRNVRLFTQTMQKRFSLPPKTSWVNYIRSHDDIGWGFADEDAAEIGINGSDHRYFLNQFYSGAFPGTFARGVPFNYNPRTQDMRISGTSASLIGLEHALETGNETLVDYAIRRIILCQAVVMAAGGIPLIYLGDELGTLNDYTYLSDPALAEDSRWIHRPRHNWQAAEQRHDSTSIVGRIFTQFQHLIQIRKKTPAFAGGETRFYTTGNPHVIGFSRSGTILVMGNFADTPQRVEPGDFAAIFAQRPLRDMISGHTYTETITLEPWQAVWLTAHA